jgi:hypothetical protein
MAINRNKIIEDMSKIQLCGDSDGLIDACNVMVNQLPAEFWNSFADRLTNKVPKELLEATEYLLYNAAHECGYHTGHGIITSEEWKAIVKPMIEKEPEDMLYGAFAVLTAWGWAKSEIIDLEPGRKMVVRAYNYYEADVVETGKSTKKSAYLLAGICAAFMDLAYGGNYDPKGKTGLGTFICKQVKGIENGDDYGEFVVTKA